MSGHGDGHAGGPGTESAAEAVVRAATGDDVPAVQALWRTAGLQPLDDGELVATLARTWAAGRRRCTGRWRGRGRAGHLDGRRGWVHRLAVHPGHRRGGLASALVSDLERRLRERGARRVNLLVLPDNAGALRFWQRRGYLPCPDVLHTKPLP